MIIPKDSKVNGEVWRVINGNPCYRVQLTDGPARGQVALTTSTELWMNGAKYVLQGDGEFRFVEEGLPA